VFKPYVSDLGRYGVTLFFVLERIPDHLPAGRQKKKSKQVIDNKNSTSDASCGYGRCILRSAY